MKAGQGSWGKASFPWHAGTEVVACGPDWVALNKPAGVLSHPNSGEDVARAILPWNYDNRREAFVHETEGELHLCHRLDGPTSGILLLARADLAKAFREEFATRRCRKIYRALLRGNFPRAREVWRDRLGRVEAEKGVRMVAAAGGAAAETEVTVLARRPGKLSFTEVHLMPLTGRTHQLRVQSARRGFPIIGDATYGDFAFNRRFAAEAGDKHCFLHAESLHLQVIWKGRPVVVAVQCPAPFAGYSLPPGGAGSEA